MLAVTIHDAVALAIGWTTATVGGLGTRERKAMTFEVGIRNAGLGLGLIFTFFGGLGGMAIAAGYGWTSTGWRRSTGSASASSS